MLMQPEELSSTVYVVVVFGIAVTTEPLVLLRVGSEDQV